MTRLCLVHLVWAPLGQRPLERFVSAYRAHRPGLEHGLLVLFNGFAPTDDLARWQESLAGVSHQELRLERPVLDLDAYRQAVERVVAERYCFVNSHSQPLVEGWLAHLAGQLDVPGVGVVGVGGSLESAYSSAPRPLRPFRRRFAPFPNAHVRTNGFMLERELMLDLDWPVIRSKVDAWALESGKRSISRQVWERGLDVRVVGRDGVAYSSERWRESATFRSGGQRNLLISDNRTLQYERADAAFKDTLERMAWGPV
jgi:hypothetical protein